MSEAIAVLAHVFIGVVLIALFLLLLGIAATAKTWSDRLIRFTALAMGFIVYYGASVLGIPVPKLLYQAAQASGFFEASILGLVLPAVAGIALAAFIARTLQTRGDRQTKALLFIGVLTFCVFGDIFSSNVIGESPLKTYSNESQRLQEELDRASRRFAEMPAPAVDAAARQAPPESESQRQARLEIASLERKLHALSKSRSTYLLALLGPNIAFVLSLLFYLVFIFDRQKLEQAFKSRRQEDRSASAI